jgi:uncharacterized membrane-anchored protein YhcB (DUF1043 family)
MRFKKVEIGLNILFLGLTSWLFITSNSVETQAIVLIDGEKVKQVIRSESLTVIAITEQFFFLLLFYLELYFIHQLSKSKKIGLFIVKSFLSPFFITTLIFLTLRLIFINRPDKILYDSSSGNLIFYLAVAICYGFIKLWNKNERDRTQLELVKNQAELNLLRLQLQPHFLFNTMNNLLSMVNQSDNPKLAQSIDKLSGLLRYVVYETQSKKTLLRDEIQFIRNFAELHLLRYEEDEVNFSIYVKGNYDEQLIEPGIFLSYIENAFKHGVQPETASYISIFFDISNQEHVVFKIENSIPEVANIHDHGGYGLESSSERLRLTYPDKYSLEITEEDGYSVTLNINTA